MASTSDTELAWAAGFFDGEGHIGYHSRCIRAGAGQVERDTLKRFMAAVGMGWIRGPFPRARRAMYYWDLTGRHRINQFVCLLWPYLCEPKRAQIHKAYGAYRDDPITRRRSSVGAKKNGGGNA